jgi:DNA-binding transcriptional MerR regulator
MTDAFQPIRDVSKILGVPAHTLRYWEKTFPSAIQPVTGTGGRRYYRPDTVRALQRIKDLLYAQGYTIAGVKKVLSSGRWDERTDSSAPHKDAVEKIKRTLPPSAPAALRVELDRAIDLLTMAKKALL